MLTALELENFKGISARQRIEFAPLTLLFGANSAGKSTILQALLYLHELIQGGHADVDRTELGGAVLELGGFRRLVHRHEVDRAIVVRAEFSTPGGLERFERDLSRFPFPDLDDEIEHVWLELTARSRLVSGVRRPVIDRAAIGTANVREPLVELQYGATGRPADPLDVTINLEHPLLSAAADDPLVESWGTVAAPLAPPQLEVARVPADGPVEWHVEGGANPRRPRFAVSRRRESALPHPDEALHVIPYGEDSVEKAAIAAQVRTLLEMVVLGTTAQLASLLRDSIYIGPLRAMPPRGFLYERAGRITSWADGLAAWDLLLADRVTLVERTNQWLSRLGAGCQIVVQELFERSANAEELSAGHIDKTVRRLLLDTGAGSFVLPSEVGAGVSQVVPVIVAAQDSRAGMTLVEQPELHVHPAMQVGLGDLFINSATRDGNRRAMLVETHSEHLILRLLRRIRETTDHELPEGTPAFTQEMICVQYVEGTADGVKVRRLRVDDRGEFKDPWPKGFFHERMRELL